MLPNALLGSQLPVGWTQADAARFWSTYWRHYCQGYNRYGVALGLARPVAAPHPSARGEKALLTHTAAAG